ncbi:MAG: mevalonate kinase, partial [Halobacteria archaeon]|nr:mevalonate kinase [Halobacteria archaeon]
SYVTNAIEKARAEADSDKRVEVTIESDVPVGAGLGSSAAVVVATVHAVSNELGSEIERERVAEIGHEVELAVQGSASPADTFASAMGGMVYVEPDEELRRLDTPDFDFVVGYDGESAPTGEMVAGVRELVESNEIAEHVVEDIGDITRLGVESVESDDLEKTGELMNLGHGLLESLGVGSASLARMVWAARDSGAYGAKLTGAGGGGCIVSLVDDTKIDKVGAGIDVIADEVYTAQVAEGVRQRYSRLGEAS